MEQEPRKTPPVRVATVPGNRIVAPEVSPISVLPLASAGAPGDRGLREHSPSRLPSNTQEAPPSPETLQRSAPGSPQLCGQHSRGLRQGQRKRRLPKKPESSFFSFKLENKNSPQCVNHKSRCGPRGRGAGRRGAEWRELLAPSSRPLGTRLPPAGVRDVRFYFLLSDFLFPLICHPGPRYPSSGARSHSCF